MRKILFVDSDTQYDFMDPKGALYIKGAVSIIPRIKKLTRFADNFMIPICSVMDIHPKNDPEFKLFPAHCLKNTPGASKIKETIAGETRQIFLRKQTFSVFSNPRAKRVFSKFEVVYIYGVALDYCVKFASLGARDLDIETYVVKDATIAITRKSGIGTIKLLKSRGVKFINTDELMRKIRREKRIGGVG